MFLIAYFVVRVYFYEKVGDVYNGGDSLAGVNPVPGRQRPDIGNRAADLSVDFGSLLFLVELVKLYLHKLNVKLLFSLDPLGLVVLDGYLVLKPLSLHLKLEYLKLLVKLVGLKLGYEVALGYTVPRCDIDLLDVSSVVAESCVVLRPGGYRSGGDNLPCDIPQRRRRCGVGDLARLYDGSVINLLLLGEELISLLPGRPPALGEHGVGSG